VTTGARTLAVPALRQVTVAALGLLPNRPAPIVLSSADPWDRQFLGTAIDLTVELDGASRGFTPNAPADTADFFRRALTPLATEVSFSDQLLSATRPASAPARAPGEVLVGASIALAAPSRSASFDQRWSAVFAFRDEGAAWGLVVLDQAADPATVLDLIGRAVNQPVLLFSAPVRSVPAPGLGGPPPELASPAVTSPPATTSPAGSKGRPPVTSPSRPAPTSPGPVPVPPPSPVSPVVNPLVQLVNRSLGGLLPKG
jgi:hypothetical protein